MLPKVKHHVTPGVPAFIQPLSLAVAVKGTENKACAGHKQGSIFSGRMEWVHTTQWKGSVQNPPSAASCLAPAVHCSVNAPSGFAAGPVTTLTFTTSKGNHVFPAGIRRVYPLTEKHLQAA